ncbi:MAG: glycine--tRNA ligase [Bacteroidota bacterium]
MTKHTITDLSPIIAHAKAYGFIYPSSEIYDGLQAVYDYAPYGVLLKRNLQTLWWKTMTQLRADVVGLDAAILMHPTTWEASGHLAGFHDFFVDHKTSNKRYRVDHLVEAHIEGLSQQAKEGSDLMEKMHDLMQVNDGAGLADLLTAAGIVCPVAKDSNWAPAKKINLMFATQAGAIEGASKQIYLRPETAQGIFVNFGNVQKATRMKVPFGIAQIGKAFRNELIARQFTFRMREFEQMEMQYFIRPGEEKRWFDYWQAQREGWYAMLGIPQEDLRIHPHEQLAHYATAAVDIEYRFPFGFKEVEGIHSRTDFDLKNHQTYARKKLTYFDPQTNEAYLPYVIETSAGCDRLLLMLLCHAFTQETNEKGTTRTYLRLPAPLAPIQAAILPLFKKEPFAHKAKEVFDQLKYNFSLAYDEGGSIGKRYARQDLIGTPFCLTVDHQTLEDDTVTVRERDTMAQVRMSVHELRDYLYGQVGMETMLR